MSWQFKSGSQAMSTSFLKWNHHTGNYCIPATLSPWEELTSPTSKFFLQSPMTVLSCHNTHHEEPNVTSTSGYSNYFPTQLVPSQALALSSTSVPSQMQAQALVLLLSSETGGVHGNSYQDGNPANKTSNGLKEWVSSFLSEQSQCKVCTLIIAFILHNIEIRASKDTHGSKNPCQTPW